MEELIKAMRRLKVETGSLVCLGCGHEHNCSTRGCAIIREAIDRLCLMEWIDPELEVPNLAGLHSDFVLAVVSGKVGNCTYDHAIEVVSYEDGKWWLADYPSADISVSHWMPLPDAPKPEVSE